LDQAEREGEFPAERREVGVGRKERLIGWKRHNRDVDGACFVRDRKPIDPDAALVERLRHREEAAVTALVAAHGDRVYRLAIRLTGNSSDARRHEGNATFVLHDLEGLSNPAIAEAAYMSDPAEECLRRLPC
jgi:hypothetical protein